MASFKNFYSFTHLYNKKQLLIPKDYYANLNSTTNPRISDCF